MLALASSLALVALLDSLSIIPLCIVFLIVLLAGPRPVVRSSAFLFGVFISYLAAGVLVMLGLQEIFDEVNAYLVRLWKSPYTEELILQIVLGAVLVAFGWRLAVHRAKHASEPTAEAMTAAAKGCYDAATGYGTPFISGKDSLNNEFQTDTGENITIPSTLLIS